MLPLPGSAQGWEVWGPARRALPSFAAGLLSERTAWPGGVGFCLNADRPPQPQPDPATVSSPPPNTLTPPLFFPGMVRVLF